MLKRLLGRLALRAISSDSPVVDVDYSQDADDGVWKATFSIAGSDREWATSIRFEEKFEVALAPELPPGFVRNEYGYATPYLLSRSCPVQIFLRSKRLATVSGTVFVNFESKGRVGGTGITRFIPIGFSDPALLARYEASVRRNREARSSAHEV